MQNKLTLVNSQKYVATLEWIVRSFLLHMHWKGYNGGKEVGKDGREILLIKN